MLHDIVKKGSVDRSVTLRIIDSTDGTPETGVVYNTAGIDLWYRREGAAVVSITEATLAALTTVHTDGGFLTISHGYYRLDLPDAAFATGANHVDFGGTVTGMVVIGGRVRLVDYDPEDTVRMGLTALPASGTLAVNPILNATQTGVTIPTVTTLTNAPTDSSGVTTLLTRISAALGFTGAYVNVQVKGQDNIDFGALQKTSLNAATPASVAGAVGSVAAGVTVTTNNDKTGYGLSTAAVQAIWDALTSALTTVGSIGKKLADWVIGTSQTGDSFARLGAPAGASVSADVAAVKVDTAATLAESLTHPTLAEIEATAVLAKETTVAARATPAQVNAEVLDVLNVDTFAEPGQGAPLATTTLAAKINYLFKFLRNKVTQTATTLSVYDDAGTTVDQKSTVSDDATTFTRGEIGSGP